MEKLLTTEEKTDFYFFFLYIYKMPLFTSTTFSFSYSTLIGQGLYLDIVLTKLPDVRPIYQGLRPDRDLELGDKFSYVAAFGDELTACDTATQSYWSMAYEMGQDLEWFGSPPSPPPPPPPSSPPPSVSRADPVTVRGVNIAKLRRSHQLLRDGSVYSKDEMVVFLRPLGHTMSVSRATQTSKLVMKNLLLSLLGVEA